MGPLAGAALIGGIANIGGALIGGHGQSQANAANAAEAQRNRDFQERMRATQYQTAVEDMRKAGLNPALAYQQGGAGTVSGSTAQHQNVAADAATSASSAVAQFQSLRKTAAEIENVQSDTATKDLARTIMGWEGEIKFLDLLRNRETLRDVIQKIRNEAAMSGSTAREAAASARIRELGIPEAEAIANFYRSFIGKYSPYMNSGTAVLRGLGGLLTRGRSLRGRALQQNH